MLSFSCMKETNSRYYISFFFFDDPKTAQKAKRSPSFQGCILSCYQPKPVNIDALNVHFVVVCCLAFLILKLLKPVLHPLLQYVDYTSYIFFTPVQKYCHCLCCKMCCPFSDFVCQWCDNIFLLHCLSHLSFSVVFGCAYNII